MFLGVYAKELCISTEPSPFPVGGRDRHETSGGNRWSKSACRHGAVYRFDSNGQKLLRSSPET